MSTQQDIYAAGSKSRPPMLNKENYMPWSSRLLCYAKSRPNGKLIHNSIINGPYADDQAIQIILLGLPEDIYAAVNSCETAQEIWLRVQQMMKGSDIRIQEKKANQNGVGMLLSFIRLRICIQLITLNSPHQDQPSFNQNYMQQPMQNPEDITDPTTAMNMTLALMAKAFKLKYSTPTNKNQRISSNLRNRQIAQPGMNMGKDRQMQLVGVQNLRVQNIRNQNGLIGVPGNANQNLNGNGNLVAARAKGNATGHNDLDKIEEVNPNYILMANLQQASTSGTQIDKAPVYDSDKSAEAHDHENCDDYEIFNMFTQEEHMEQSGETVEQHPANFEETRALYDSLYQNLAIEVEKVNTINRKLKETNADLTTELARFKNQEKCYEISQEKYDKLERCYQQYVYQEQCLSKKINALHLSFGKQIMTLNEERSNLNKQLSKENSTVSFLLEEKKRLKSDFKTHEDKLLDKQIQLKKKIKELNNILVKTGQSIQTIHMLSPKPDSFYHTEQKMALGY
nr:hypothetical protein [Tanacetum cinerariifolium]